MESDLLNATEETARNHTEPAPSIPESTSFWAKEPYAWSSSLGYTPPLLTSGHCTNALYKLFHNSYYSDAGNEDPYQPNFLLSVVVESSSHPSGLDALYAQPWMYAGPGLGNLDECPLQTCIAGGRETDSITFASLCMVPECSAYDLASDDFVSTASREFEYAISEHVTPDDSIALGKDYISLLQRVADINKFLKTGFTCGAFVVPFEALPFGVPFVLVCVLLVVLAGLGTKRSGQRVLMQAQKAEEKTLASTVLEEVSSLIDGRPTAADRWQIAEPSERHSAFWTAFDVPSHLEELFAAPQHHDTACLDGLRVGSIMWIVLGHVMAVQSSSGAGYANPVNFLPPTGLTTTFIGQLLFSSRLAVDTFLTISGFLVVYVLQKKMPFQQIGTKSLWSDVFVRYVVNLPSLVLARVARIMPLYSVCLGFYTQIAPHLGGGPFWHQWIGLLKPCRDAIWTNFLFVNNFLPFDRPTTSTCFYHSWYLAVDMQLFIVAPLLVFWYQVDARQAQLATICLYTASVLTTAILSYTRHWSVNTFDGIAVDRYDMEAYAKPHVRAQAYLAGMFVAMRLLAEKARTSSQLAVPNVDMKWRMRLSRGQRLRHYVALAGMVFVTFVTATGAYARRPCTYKEDPYQNDCGSRWSPFSTFLYAALSRVIWSLGVAEIIHTSVGRGQSVDRVFVATVLSWRCWTPLSRLTFGAYLIHPIVIFVWQLADREKQVFRLLTFGMDYISVSMVSFVAALVAAVVVEFPFANLWKLYMARIRCVRWHRSEARRMSESQLSSLSSVPSKYGSTTDRTGNKK